MYTLGKKGSSWLLGYGLLLLLSGATGCQKAIYFTFPVTTSHATSVEAAPQTATKALSTSETGVGVTANTSDGAVSVPATRRLSLPRRKAIPARLSAGHNRDVPQAAVANSSTPGPLLSPGRNKASARLLAKTTHYSKVAAGLLRVGTSQKKHSYATQSVRPTARDGRFKEFLGNMVLVAIVLAILLAIVLGPLWLKIAAAGFLALVVLLGYLFLRNFMRGR
jgi:hypothetical protein